ncbi:MAG: dephospho-CoA kinase [Acidimicrobiales bacterium]
MILVGLTGGIGAGKSTVAAALVRRGAALVDADRVARQVLEPNGGAYHAVVRRFGAGIVEGAGHIDRRALAAVAFSDPAALADLNALTHPVIRRVMADRIAEHRSAAGGRPGAVVVDIPLVDRTTVDGWALDGLVVVDTPDDEALRRLVDQRGLSEGDARARMANQISRAARRALVAPGPGSVPGHVVDNSGTLGALEAEVDRAWDWIESIGAR